jgi:8-oxo-dGTP diphosphatase
VPVLRATALIIAPRRTVAGLLRDPDTVTAAIAAAGHRFRGPRRPLVADDEVRLTARLLPGLALPMRIRIIAVGVDGMRSELVAGPARRLEHTVVLSEDGAGTLLLEELRWGAPLGLLGRIADVVLLRRAVRRLLTTRAAVLAERAAVAAARPVVVAAAVVRDGQVLAARRRRPPELAGRWELPGGRVEPGEAESDAVVRECREELDTEIRVTGRVGTDLLIAPGLLRVHTAELGEGAPEPRALEHSELRWADADELAGLDWLDADIAVVDDLRSLLAPG